MYDQFGKVRKIFFEEQTSNNEHISSDFRSNEEIINRQSYDNDNDNDNENDNSFDHGSQQQLPRDSENQTTQSKKRKVKNHGFTKPLNCLQILSWVIFFLDLIVFFSINLYAVPFQDDNLHGIAWFGVIYFLLAAAVVTLAVIATRIDPTDPLVYQQRREKAQGLAIQPKEDKLYCSVCDTHVQLKTKHCGQCNRCVNQFDHHCKWLNNCVGQRNYRYFVALITACWFYSVIHITTAIYLLSIESNRFVIQQKLFEI